MPLGETHMKKSTDVAGKSMDNRSKAAEPGVKTVPSGGPSSFSPSDLSFDGPLQTLEELRAEVEQPIAGRPGLAR